jgi:hypothetical protein
MKSDGWTSSRVHSSQRCSFASPLSGLRTNHPTAGHTQQNQDPAYKDTPDKGAALIPPIL